MTLCPCGSPRSPSSPLCSRCAHAESNPCRRDYCRIGDELHAEDDPRHDQRKRVKLPPRRAGARRVRPNLATINQIVAATSNATGVAAADILSRRRFRAITDARYAAILVALRVTGCSQGAIAEAMNADAMTVSLVARSFVARVAADESLRRLVSDIEATARSAA